MKPIERIIDLGSAFFQIDREVLTSRLRDEPTARIRFCIMGACRIEGYTLNVIGAAFNRDHGTVSNAIKNLTPEAMPHLWSKHLKFLELVKLREDLDEKAIPDVAIATRIAIRQIDQKLRELSGLRRTLVDSMTAIERFESCARVSTETPAHWQEKG